MRLKSSSRLCMSFCGVVVLSATLVVVPCLAQTAAADVPRLFFTPEQRETIRQLRQPSAVAENLSVTLPEPEPEPVNSAPEPVVGAIKIQKRFKLNGFLTGHRNSRIWLDGKRYRVGDRIAGKRLRSIQATERGLRLTFDHRLVDAAVGGYLTLLVNSPGRREHRQ